MDKDEILITSKDGATFIQTHNMVSQINLAVIDIRWRRYGKIHLRMTRRRLRLLKFL